MFLVHRNSLFSPSDCLKKTWILLSNFPHIHAGLFWTTPLTPHYYPQGHTDYWPWTTVFLTWQKRTLDYPPFGVSLHCQFLHLRLFSQGKSLSLERSGARNSYKWALGVNPRSRTKQKSSQKSQEKVTILALRCLSCCLSNRQLIL